MRLVLRVVDTPAGGVAVLPDRARVQAQAEGLRHQAKELEGEAKERTLEVADAMLERLAALDEATEGIVREEVFELRPYTYGEKLEARRAATSWEGGQPMLDQDRYSLELAARSSGMSADELGGKPAPIAQAVVAAAVELSEPNPEALDFLFTARTASA